MTAQSSTGDEVMWDQQRLIAAVAAVEGRLRSIEVEAMCSFVDGAGQDGGSVRLRMTRRADPDLAAIVVACPEILPWAEGGFVECERTDAWDGARGMTYTAAQGRAGQPLHAIRRGRVTAEPPAMLWSGIARSGWPASVFGASDGPGERLSEALADAGSACTVASRDGRINARIVHGPRTWELELELRGSGPALRNSRVRVDGLISWEVHVTSFLDMGDGLEFPAECERVEFDPSGEPRLRARTRVIRARANVAVGDHTFRVDLPPGARLTGVTGETAIVGAAPARRRAADAALVASAHEPSRRGSGRGRGVSTSNMWLGFTALGVAMAAWAARRF